MQNEETKTETTLTMTVPRTVMTTAGKKLEDHKFGEEVKIEMQVVGHKDGLTYVRAKDESGEWQTWPVSGDTLVEVPDEQLQLPTLQSKLSQKLKEYEKLTIAMRENALLLSAKFSIDDNFDHLGNEIGLARALLDAVEANAFDNGHMAGDQSCFDFNLYGQAVRTMNRRLFELLPDDGHTAS